MRYLGIDYGTGKVGIALSDEAGTMGFPKTSLENGPRLMQEVRELAAAENVGAVVIGESLDFSGNPNPVALDARAFGAKLEEESGLPVYFEIEALSTQEARRAPDGTHPLHAANVQRQRSEKGMAAGQRGAVDARAAALILTSYLSRNHD